MTSFESISAGNGGSIEQELRRHEERRRVIHDLELCIAGTADPGVDQIPRLQVCFHKFAAVIRTYLEGEEQGRLYRELPGTFPRLANRAKSLGREQRRIRRELDALIVSVGTLEGAAAEEVAAIKPRVVRLVVDLKSLDDRETELLQSAYWRETGVGD
jgi:hypothetical protein